MSGLLPGCRWLALAYSVCCWRCSAAARSWVSRRPKTAHFWQQKHWLTIDYEGGYAYMQLDKNNQRQIRAALGVAGFEVETIIED